MIVNFERKLEEYAELLVKTGLAVMPGQTVSISCAVDNAKLARLCAKYCYEAGARDVIMLWNDDELTRLRYMMADSAVFDEVRSADAALYGELLDLRSPRLALHGSDPESLKGVDADRVARRQRSNGVAAKDYFSAQTSNKFQWCVAGCPCPAWAKKVFPDLPVEDAVEKLWEAIFAVCRVEGDGKAAERWSKFAADQKRIIAKLNEYRFTELRYKNSLGTDLVIGLPEGHIWSGATEMSEPGAEFVANIPTEEIFTAPHRLRADGIVYSTKPLVMHGNLVENFSLRFENGRIVEVKAEHGEEFLRAEIDMDDGARYLGEVALVPQKSPISESGILFYDTLFDENASCHFAFGSAYPCIEGAAGMSDEELLEKGINDSITHVDFMVGSADLSIIGITADGTEIAVFENGNWAF